MQKDERSWVVCVVGVGGGGGGGGGGMTTRYTKRTDLLSNGQNHPSLGCFKTWYSEDVFLALSKISHPCVLSLVSVGNTNRY